jgi:hypothetical protein
MSSLGNPLVDNPDQRTLDLFRRKMSAIQPLAAAPAATHEDDARPLPLSGPVQPAPTLTRGEPRPAGPSPLGMSATPETQAPSLVPFGAPRTEPATLTPSLLGGPKAAGPLATPATAPASPLTGQTPHQAELARLTTGETGKSGIAQIKNPWLRGLATVGDVIGSGFFPRAAAAIPGTSLHHQGLVNMARSAVANDESQATSEAQREHLGAETNEANARAKELTNPPEKTVEHVADAEGNLWALHPGSEPTQIMAGGKPLKAAGKIETPEQQWIDSYLKDPKNSGKDVRDAIGEYNKQAVEGKTPKEGDEPLGKSVDQINAAMKARFQVLHPGAEMPAHYVLPKESTRGDFARIDKLMEGEEHAFGTKANQEASKAAREQAQALAQANRKEKGDTQTRSAAFKAYTPALDSGERFNVMAENYDKAVKNHDQQAMLSLLANHLGMTMGLQKGARLNQAIISEAQKSLPWLQGLKAKFGPDGYMTGVTLSPEQMHQMLDLGRSRFSEDLTKGRNEARYLGSTDEGPERTPNRATIGYYMTMSDNDLAKAKKLAAADGWTVK